jgi:REP element-mobilizing transposase RayT
MSDPQLQIRQRNLPHWTLDGSTYFVTFRLAISPFDEAERRIVLSHICTGADKYYLLIAAVVMPDHVHILLHPNKGITLSRIMKGIKGASARLINEYRNTTGTVWQAESWDRIVRDADELEEKLQYMANNPIKAGLVDDISRYVGWYCNPESL